MRDRQASTYDKSATSPFAGLVLRLWDTVSIYGNYIEGLSRGDVAPAGAANSGTVLAPYVARQIEVGVKVDWGALSTNLAAFRITKPSGELGSDRVYAQTGEQRIDGLELTIYGEVVPGIRALGGVTLFDGTLTRTLGARYATEIGGRRTVFRANVIDVANAKYWTGVVSYGTFFQAAPRTYLLSMSVDL